MNDRARGTRSAQEPDIPENAAVTGVAKGALGTDTALEDTQEWVVPPELRAGTADPQPAAVAAVPTGVSAATGEAEVMPSAEPALGTPAPAEPALAAPAPVEEVRPTTPQHLERRPRGGFAATPRAAGLAAAMLFALVGVAAVMTSQDHAAPGAGTAPADQATAAPTVAPPADAGGGNGGNGNDKKDNDKGGGNGKGNGGGNGSD